MAHELGKKLSEVEEMTPDELHLHLSFMGWRASEEKKAVDKAKRDQKGGGMTPLASFNRR